jgi:putative FmdB family regulatory protein
MARGDFGDLRWYAFAMPLYEYRCNDCAGVFEVLRPIAERELAAVCPGCESRASMPLISRVAAIAGGASASALESAPSSGGGCCGGSCGCG